MLENFLNSHNGAKYADWEEYKYCHMLLAHTQRATT